MGQHEGSDHYIVKVKRLRNRLTAVREPVTERHVNDIIVQGRLEKYRGIKLTTYKDPEFDLPTIQATMRHVYLDELSCNKGKGKLIAGRSVAVSVESAPDPTSIICHSCGKE